MSRPSQNINIKLIELGKKHVLQNGLAKLSIRSICSESGINLGMFFYYFRSKRNFIKIIFESFSDSLREYWLKESEGIDNPADKLKKALQLNAKLFKEHRGVFETLVKEIDFQDEMYMEIFKQAHVVWHTYYANLIEECKNGGYINKNIDTDVNISILAGSIMHYSKHCEINNFEDYYNRVNKMIDFLMEKLK